MDISPEYIKQCEKAGEIQRGKHYPVTMGQKIIFWENDVFAQINLATTNWKIVWLPRQDQLQEMIKRQNVYTLLYAFDKWRESINDDPILLSMEQFWLAFVMSERYLKTWNGSEWIAK